MRSLHRDHIEVHKLNGEVIPNLRASVQINKIYMDAQNIAVEAGDKVLRLTSVGHIERYEVLDPGFHEGLGGIPPNYQMHVRNLAFSSQATQSQPSQVIYNFSGANARLTNGIDHSTNYSQQSTGDLATHLAELKEAVQRAPGLSVDQIREALELVDEINAHCTSKSPKRSVIQAMLSALPSVATIAKAGAALLTLV